MIIKIFQLHKREASVFEKIEDQCAVNPGKNVYALADGASQKFMSGLWAKTLVESFVKDPVFEATAFKQKAIALAEEFDNKDIPFSSNSAMRAVEKKKAALGASCTFLGMALDGRDSGNLIACGDSNFFQFREQKMIDCFPYTDWEGIRNNSDFLNTKRIQEKSLDVSIIKSRAFKYAEGDVFVLASDALSCLVFKKQAIVDELWAMRDFDTFLKFCERHWDNNAMTEDDISVIIIKASKNNDVEKFLPPEGFAFPKPLAPILNFNPNQSENMKEVMQQINRTGNEIKELILENEQKGAKANRLILLLLGAGIFLTLFNCAFLFVNIKHRASTQEVSKIEKKVDTLNSRLEAFQLDMERYNDNHLKPDAVTNTSSPKEIEKKTDSLPSSSKENSNLKESQSKESAKSQNKVEGKDGHFSEANKKNGKLGTSQSKKELSPQAKTKK